MSALPSGISSAGAPSRPNPEGGSGFDLKSLMNQFLRARGVGGADDESINPLVRLLANTKIAVATPNFALQAGGQRMNPQMQALLDALIASRRGAATPQSGIDPLGAVGGSLDSGIQRLGGGPSTDPDIPIRRPMRISSDDDPPPFPQFSFGGFQGANFQ